MDARARTEEGPDAAGRSARSATALPALRSRWGGVRLWGTRLWGVPCALGYLAARCPLPPRRLACDAQRAPDTHPPGPRGLGLTGAPTGVHQPLPPVWCQLLCQLSSLGDVTPLCSPTQMCPGHGDVCCLIGWALESGFGGAQCGWVLKSGFGGAHCGWVLESGFGGAQCGWVLELEFGGAHCGWVLESGFGGTQCGWVLESGFGGAHCSWVLESGSGVPLLRGAGRRRAAIGSQCERA